MKAKALIKNTSFVLLFQITTVFLALIIIPINIKYFGVEKWSVYQYKYILLIGSFNWIGGLPLAFNRLFALNEEKNGIKIVFNTLIIALFYSVFISICIYFIIRYFDIEVWPLPSLFASIFLYNIWVIGRNALEVKGYFFLSSFIKFVFQLIVLTTPLIFSSFSFNYLVIFLLLINCLIYALIFYEKNRIFRVDLKLIKNIIREGIKIFKYSGLNQLYLMGVPLLVRSIGGATIFGFFVPIFELTGKSGIIGNAINTVIAPSVSNGSIKSNVLRNSNTQLFVVLVITGLIVGLLSSGIVQSYYLKTIPDSELQIIYQILLIAFLVMSLVALNLRVIIASGEVRSVLKITMLTYFIAFILMVFASNVKMVCIIFLARSIIEFLYIQKFVRSNS